MMSIDPRDLRSEKDTTDLPPEQDPVDLRSEANTPDLAPEADAPDLWSPANLPDQRAAANSLDARSVGPAPGAGQATDSNRAGPAGSGPADSGPHDSGQADEAAALRSVLDRTASLIDRVTPDAWEDPTPCEDWTVQRLLAHIVGWTEAFADRAEGVDPDFDPDARPVDDESGARFRTAAVRINAAEAGDGPRPAKAADPGILIAEYICHGTDLARATGQRIDYVDASAEIGLRAMRGMLTPEYREYGFSAEVQVDPNAGAVARLLAFSGRSPGETAGAE